MHPILIQIGSFRLPTYGFLLVCALVGAIYTATRLGRRSGMDAGQILDFSTWLIFVALVGAKVLAIFQDPSYLSDPGHIFSWATLEAGGAFYGGFIAAALFAWWYVRVNRLPALRTFDVFAPAIALGQSVGRVGCFSAGCCYGKPTHLFLGVVFTNAYSHAYTGVPLNTPLYPTELMESAAMLMVFGVLLWRFRTKKRDGQVFVLYLALYAMVRFFIEFLRGDPDRGSVFHGLLSTPQFIAVLAFMAACGLAFYIRRHPAEQAVPLKTAQLAPPR